MIPRNNPPSEDLRALEFELPIQVLNPLNTREHWTTRADRMRRQRDYVCVAILRALMGGRYKIAVPSDRPKRVTFTVHHGRRFDDDGLVASLKAVRDGLMDAAVIHDDGPSTGHEFRYEQVGNTPRSVRRVVVRIELRPRIEATP